jgi:hypothetical protein
VALEVLKDEAEAAAVETDVVDVIAGLLVAVFEVELEQAETDISADSNKIRHKLTKIIRVHFKPLLLIFLLLINIFTDNIHLIYLLNVKNL